MRFPSRFPERLAAALLALCLSVGGAGADTFARLNAAVEGADGASALTAALVARAEALRLAGLPADALEDLSRAVETAPSAPEQAFAAAAFGVALNETGRRAAAERQLRAALAGGDGQPAVTAIAAATLAGMIASDRRVETSAMRAARFGEAADLAARAADDARAAGPVVRGVVATARARVALANRDAEAARAILAKATPELAALGHAAALALIGLGDAALAAGAPAISARAYAAAEGARGRLGALAALGAGEAAMAEGRLADALAASDEAARFALTLGAEDIHFSADWLRAEALSRAGRSAAAAAAFEMAFESLRDYRARAPLGAPPVASQRRYAPRRFQLEYIDFLLAADRADASLFKARDLVEDLKLDEIDDYFAERCTPARGQVRDADALGGATLVLYPIVFDDRTEMIWTIGDRIGGYRVEATRDDLRREITGLRYQIDLRIGGLEPAAGALYDRLLGPLHSVLARGGVRTLVVAPDGPLRALPFAALWDGEGYLGARYGLATILGLSLVDTGETSLVGASVLAAGAEDVNPDYSPLPSVPLELAAIRDVFGAEVLAEGAFSAEALSAEIARRPYDVVHIATHAEFGATPADNFILTTGGRLDVTQLEATMRARAVQTATPISLLTLSACNTAAELGGEMAERAPLGLAGVGFRAGARSVLASLWPAEDLSTARLMALFYAALNEGAGRAEALRRAQAALIADPETADPFQWANFMLIGDWR